MLANAQAIHHTCYGLVDLCKYLLQTKNLILAKFSSDTLEKDLENWFKRKV